MSTFRSVSVRHVPQHSAFLDSACYVEIVRHVNGKRTGSTFFDIGKSYFDLCENEFDFIRLCSALGKRLRVSGEFSFLLRLNSGTVVDELIFGAELLFIDGWMQQDLFSYPNVVFRSVH